MGGIFLLKRLKPLFKKKKKRLNISSTSSFHLLRCRSLNLTNANNSAKFLQIAARWWSLDANRDVDSGCVNISKIKQVSLPKTSKPHQSCHYRMTQWAWYLTATYCVIKHEKHEREKSDSKTSNRIISGFLRTVVGRTPRVPLSASPSPLLAFPIVIAKSKVFLGGTVAHSGPQEPPGAGKRIFLLGWKLQLQWHTSEGLTTTRPPWLNEGNIIQDSQQDETSWKHLRMCACYFYDLMFCLLGQQTFLLGALDKSSDTIGLVFMVLVLIPVPGNHCAVFDSATGRR